MASKAADILGDALSGTRIVDNKRDTDTIRLWEGYREQATLWRTLSLLQIPTTLICAIMAIIFYVNQRIVLNVPAKPLPGIYSVEEIMDAEFKETATNLVNLIATYQPAVARRQFTKAREMISEPMLTRFDDEMLGAELKTIENTKRTQLYFVDPATLSIARENGVIEVSMIGDRAKIVAGKELPTVTTKYTVTMSTIPRNELNPYGIMVTNVKVENIEK